MRVAINHETVYRYHSPANYSIQYLRLTPLSGPNQRVISWKLSTPGNLRTWTDGFGNQSHVLVVDEPHDEIRITAMGEVELADSGSPLLSEHDPLPPEIFLRSTRLTQPDERIRAFSNGFRPGIITNPRKGLDGLMAGIRDTVEYRPGVTHSATSARQALDARAGVAASSIDGRRQLYSIAQDGTVAVNRQVKDTRNAVNYTLHVGGSYEQGLGGGFYLRPQLHLDYFGMNEGGFKENDTIGTGFALAVNSRSGSEGSGTATVVLGRSTGTDFRVRPELELGVRDAFSGSAGNTTARFVSGGSPFVLNPTDLSGVGGIARVGVKMSTDFYEVGLHAGVEVRDHFGSGDARVTVRLLF